MSSQSWSEHDTFTAVSAPFDAGVDALSGGYEGACGIMAAARTCRGLGV